MPSSHPPSSVVTLTARNAALSTYSTVASSLRMIATDVPVTISRTGTSSNTTNAVGPMEVMGLGH